MSLIDTYTLHTHATPIPCTMIISYVVYLNVCISSFRSNISTIYMYLLFIYKWRDNNWFDQYKLASKWASVWLCNDKIKANLLILLALYVCHAHTHTYRKIVNFTTNWLTSKSASTTTTIATATSSSKRANKWRKEEIIGEEERERDTTRGISNTNNTVPDNN